MKKQLLLVALVMVMLCALLPQIIMPASAGDVILPPDEFGDNTVSGTCGSGVKWELNKDTGVLKITGTGKMDGYIINSMLTFAPWHDYSSNVKSAIISNGVTSIGDCAFYDCTELTSVTIPDSVTSIGDSAFYDCTGLTSVTIPDSVTSIEDCAFDGCTRLTSIIIPDSVTNISDWAFSYCNGLTSISVDVNNSVYDSRNNCNAIIESATNRVIAGCINTIIPDSVICIGDGSFSFCTGLKNITVPNSVVKIDESAFYSCTGLESITISDSVEYIGWAAFDSCTALTDVYYLGTETDWKAITIDGYNECLTGATIHFIEHTHDYTVVVTAPTCTEKGYTTHTCSCGDSYIDSYTNALGHNVITDKAAAATCTETGLTEGSHCARCKEVLSKQEVVAALGHAWDAGVITVQPTATEKGIKTYTCTRCSATKTESVPELIHEHSYTAVVTAPTCTEQGYTTHTCACGDSYKDTYTNALGHSFVNGVCTRCSAKDPNYVPPVKPDIEFTDVTSADWYYKAVNFAVSNGLFNGMTATTFEPNTAMNRAMLVTVLWRYEGSPKEGTNTFADVKAGQWYTDAVAWASSNGIVGGVGEGKFDPNGNVTREQLAAILFRYCDYKEIGTDKRGELSAFPDKAKVSSWATNAYSWAVGEGLIGGNKIGGQTLLDPQGNATRAQVATILMRFIQNIA